MVSGWITGPSICIWILCWKQIGAVKSASGKGRVFAGKWVQTLACLGGTSCRHLPSYHVFHFMRIFCWFMALQVCHMQLLLNGQPCVTRHTQRKNISIISGSNIKAPVWHCLQSGPWAEEKQRSAWPLNTTGQTEVDPSYMRSADPTAFVTPVAFPRLQVLLKLLQRAILLAMPISMKYAMQICYLLSFLPIHTKCLLPLLV